MRQIVSLLKKAKRIEGGFDKAMSNLKTCEVGISMIPDPELRERLRRVRIKITVRVSERYRQSLVA